MHDTVIYQGNFARAVEPPLGSQISYIANNFGIIPINIRWEPPPFYGQIVAAQWKLCYYVKFSVFYLSVWPACRCLFAAYILCFTIERDAWIPS